ncbi:endonuclease/exonuclease/phosphatase family metal-dependent hydrolase [Pantoea ananatis]|nr:endonuclease/exonuclease/phosphatase family metal-dependent hydrolase [Pantoea ananatis]
MVDEDEKERVASMPQIQQGFSFKVLTINTHKGFAPFNRRFILPELREAVRATSADIVLLQEVMGTHDIHPLQHEKLAQYLTLRVSG